MSWLKWGSEKKDVNQANMAYLHLDTTDRPVDDENASYIKIDLGSMRTGVVSGTYAKYYDAVHSFISAPRYDQSAGAEFHVVTTPGKLKELDAGGLNRVLTINKRLLGPIPYRGGDLKVEMGLFSIKSADLAQPYLELLGDMSEKAGVAFVNSALPFVPLLKKGIDLITGNAKDATLEIGLSTEMAKPVMGWHLLMAGPKAEVAAAGLKVDAKDSRLLDKAGNPYEKYPYMLFKVSASLQREDWFQIPELVEPHAKLREAVREKDLARADKLLETFRLIAATCPDLLKGDAEKIADLLKEKYRPKDKKADMVSGEQGRDIGELKDLNLYG